MTTPTQAGARPNRILHPVLQGVRFAQGRFNAIRKTGGRFYGHYVSREAAVAAVDAGMSVGYNHDELVEVSFERMCEIAPWDYPVLFWLERLLTEGCSVLDTGGHMGTKYRAFDRHLRLRERNIRWIVHDLPAIIKSGRTRAEREGLTRLAFIDSIADAGAPDITLMSGLLQYLDIPLVDLLGQMPQLPERLIVNKAAVWDRPSAFTLENFGTAFVPYQIRNRRHLLDEIDRLGYRIEDTWTIPGLAHRIPTHPHLGRTESIGFYLVSNAVSPPDKESP